MTEPPNLEFYTRTAAMTSLRPHAARVDELPRDVGSLVRIVQGLLLHEYAASHYGVSVAEERKGESHIRRAEEILDRLLLHDDRSLSAARPPEKRLVGVCHHYVLLMVALLRAKGVPARGRCGFSAYFHRGRFEDHWVCEYWNADEKRWVLVDAQLDEVQREVLEIDFDPRDVPRSQFVLAGEAWDRCRSSEADPTAFGIFDMRGLWFVAGNVVRDVAALNKMEMLPWDVWGEMPRPGEPIDSDGLAFFDRIVALTREADASFKELSTLYSDDERVGVSAVVFNAVLKRQEVI